MIECLSPQGLFKFLPRKYQNAKKCGILTSVTTKMTVCWDEIVV